MEILLQVKNEQYWAVFVTWKVAIINLTDALAKSVRVREGRGNSRNSGLACHASGIFFNRTFDSLGVSETARSWLQFTAVCPGFPEFSDLDRGVQMVFVRSRFRSQACLGSLRFR